MTALYMPAKFIKFLEEENVLKIFYRQRFFKWDFIKIKNFLLFKDTKNWKATDREKIVTMYLRKDS